jgi:hypothetical protein
VEVFTVSAIRDAPCPKNGQRCESVHTPRREIPPQRTIL